MSEPVFMQIPVLDVRDSEINTIGQIVWLLENRASIMPGLQPPMFTELEKQRIVSYLAARYAK